MLAAIGGEPYSGIAQEKTDDPKKPASPLVAKWLSPVSMPAGGKQTFIIQGLGLRGVDDLNCRTEGIAIKVLKTEAIKPGKDETKPELDSSIEFEVTLAPQIGAGELPLVLKSPQGTIIAPFTIRVLDKSNLIEQREPAGGFKDAQPIELETVVRGAIDAPPRRGRVSLGIETERVGRLRGFRSTIRFAIGWNIDDL